MRATMSTWTPSSSSASEARPRASRGAAARGSPREAAERASDERERAVRSIVTVDDQRGLRVRKKNIRLSGRGCGAHWH